MYMIRDRIEELRRQLEYHNRKYYVENAPEISDFEFDAMMHELQQLEREHPEYADPNSPTMRVGSDLTAEFESVAHRFPMLSLGNTYSLDELHEFIGRIEKEVGETEFVCELKFDGTAISLTYEHGRLLRAVTRGDGTQGDDVTANVRTIRSVPLVLAGSDWPDYFEIRGEILMPYASFDRLNAEREAAGEPLLANPRNAAAGTLKQQSSAVVARRGLDSTLYQLAGDDLPYDSHWENMQKAREWGFKISDAMRICRNAAEIDAYIAHWDEGRRSLPFPTDGVVVKVNRYDDRRALGSTAKAPKWAVAYKFKAEQALTRLVSIDFQVGRTGAVTPVANLEPVQLAGTTVRRATLHNAEQMALLDVRPDDMVYVEKGGEIIPKITGVDLTQRPADSRPFEYITRCPVCGTPLVRYDGEAKCYCPNRNGCRPQIIGRIIHFIRRKAMDIESLGEEIVNRLYEAGLIRDAADLYDLKAEQIAKTRIITKLTENQARRLVQTIREGRTSNSQVVGKLLRTGIVREIAEIPKVPIETLTDVDFEKEIGRKTAEKIVRNIEESKNVPFHRVLFALGIPFVGETTAKYLAAHFHTLDAVMHAAPEELVEAEEIGGKIAASIIDYFADENNLQIIRRLREAGVQTEEAEKERASDTLAGLSIVISGKFANHSRDEIKELIELHGGKNLAAVSANADYLVAGENMGPAKLKKAVKLGIRILTEQEFEALLNGEDAPADAGGTDDSDGADEAARPEIQTNPGKTEPNGGDRTETSTGQEENGYSAAGKEGNARNRDSQTEAEKTEPNGADRTETSTGQEENGYSAAGKEGNTRNGDSQTDAEKTEPNGGDRTGTSTGQEENGYSAAGKDGNARNAQAQMKRDKSAPPKKSGRKNHPETRKGAEERTGANAAAEQNDPQGSLF